MHKSLIKRSKNYYVLLQFVFNIRQETFKYIIKDQF